MAYSPSQGTYILTCEVRWFMKSIRWADRGLHLATYHACLQIGRALACLSWFGSSLAEEGSRDIVCVSQKQKDIYCMLQYRDTCLVANATVVGALWTLASVLVFLQDCSASHQSRAHGTRVLRIVQASIHRTVVIALRRVYIYIHICIHVYAYRSIPLCIYIYICICYHES